MPRLSELRWITDLNSLQSDVSYDFVFVDEAGFNSHRPHTFSQLLQSFRGFKTAET
jgi:type III restriction enzyme